MALMRAVSIPTEVLRPVADSSPAFDRKTPNPGRLCAAG